MSNAYALTQSMHMMPHAAYAVCGFNCRHMQYVVSIAGICLPYAVKMKSDFSRTAVESSGIYSCIVEVLRPPDGA